jgi:S1-C subfamily serine protease
VVLSVEPGSVAERNGIKVGDVIEVLGSKSVTSVNELTDAVSGLKKGDSSRIKLNRYPTENAAVTIEKTLKF